MNTFTQQGHTLIGSSDSKDIYNVTKYFFQINAVLLNFLFIKES